jgi:hypothetical protein
MGYWQEVRDVLKKGVDLGIDNLKESAETISKKTKEGALVAKVKTQTFLKQRELHDIMADLGDAAYDAYKAQKDIYADEKIQELIVKADAIIEECRAMTAEAGIKDNAEE